MLKLCVKLDNKMNEVKRKIRFTLSNSNGLSTIEWILLVIVISGILLALKPVITNTFTKIAGLWDTELVNKFNGIK